MIGAIGSGFDRLVGVFSPAHALRRMAARDLLANARRAEKYAAAKTNRLTGSWHPVNSGVNDIIGASSSAVRGRVRQLVRDFPYFARAINSLTDYTVGEGIIYQARVQDAEGKLDRKLNQKIEDALAWWGDEADIAGKLHFYEIMRLAKRQDVESGEFLIVKTRAKDRNRYLPLALQVYEADWLASPNVRDLPSGRKEDQGIEYDGATGAVTAYHLTDPDGWGKTKRIPAEDVLHGFQTLRPGQLRGISPLAPGVLVAHSLREYMEAEIDTAKLAARYLALVKTPDPLGRQIGNTVTDPATNKKLEDIEGAIIEYLRPGEEIIFANSNRPGENFPPFVRLVLCMLAVTAGVPYELLSGSYEGLNYSVSRAVRNDFAQQLRPIARRHMRQFCIPIHREFMFEAVTFGRLSLPGYFDEPRRYLRAEWQPPGMEALDPLKETKADADGVAACLRSPQEIARKRGRELEDVYKEIAAAKEMADEYGIAPEAISTATANNPAAIEEQ